MNFKTSCFKYTGRSLKKFRDEALATTKLDQEQIVKVLRLPEGKGVVKKRIRRLTFFELCLIFLLPATLLKCTIAAVT
jgi:hypothetical protein